MFWNNEQVLRVFSGETAGIGALFCSIKAMLLEEEVKLNHLNLPWKKFTSSPLENMNLINCFGTVNMFFMTVKLSKEK